MNKSVNIFNSAIVAPKENELEIVVFGPGYGESILIHIPQKGWCVIDSCIFKSPKTQYCLPLEYLKSLDVKEIFLLALTHPHEDHYKGMDAILDNYSGNIKILSRYSGDSVREYLQYQKLNSIVTGNKDLLSIISEKFEDAANSGNSKDLRLSDSVV